MKRIDTAVLFSKMHIDNDLNLMVPIRILCGEADEKRITFTDSLSNQVFANTDLSLDADLPYGFNKVVPLKDIMKKYKAKTLLTACERYFKDIKKFVHFYDDSFVIQEMPINDFQVKYNMTIEYPDTGKVKDCLQKFVSGDIDMYDEIFNLQAKSRDNTKSILNYKISEVCNNVKKRVIAQDEAIKKIVTAIYRNVMFDDPKMKSNIFVYGPTGCGKTEIVRTIGNIFDMPVLVEDMTRYTSVGYKGADLDDMLVKLYYNANCNLELAQKSILVLDEIDKKASDFDEKSSFQKDDVLKSLLKIIEGGVFDIEIDEKNIINFDTSKLTVITCGAFSDLYEKIKPANPIGFGSSAPSVIENKKVDLESFIKYGIPVEFIGRMDTIVGLNSLAKEDLIRILKESEISPLKIYKDNLAKLNINIEFNDELCESIAVKALEKYKTGARSLKIIVDEMFGEILYGIFDAPGEVDTLAVTKETVDNPKVYKLEKRKQKEVSVSE